MTKRKVNHTILENKSVCALDSYKTIIKPDAFGFIGNPHENCDKDHQETRPGADYTGDKAQREETGDMMEVLG